MHELNIFVFILSVFTISAANQAKDNDNVDRVDRLLLNDPDIVATRFANIEKTLQDLKGELTQVKGELALEKQELTQVKGNLAREKQERQQEKANFDQVLQSFQGYGSTYVRWGRKQCPMVDTEMIYSGFTAGQINYYASKYTGGPANTLCLPNNPVLSNRTAPGGSYIYGTEFQNGDFFRKGAENEDVPCAFCRSINTTTSVMIPGRNSCQSGWKMEYHGVLASNNLQYKPSSYICVDSNPEYIQGGERNDDHNLLYATGAKCGSLPCPPYSNNMVVLCVVCSK